MKSSDVWRNRSSSSRARRSPTCAAFSIRRQKVILLRRHRIADNEERPMNGSRLLLSTALLLVGGPAFAGQAPFAAGVPDFPVSARDRVYAAEQFSNTVSVIDPSTNKNLGVIRLGDPQPMNLSPLYKGQVLVHGLGFSPDRKTLAVVSIASNSATFIDTPPIGSSIRLMSDARRMRRFTPRTAARCGLRSAARTTSRCSTARPMARKPVSPFQTGRA